MTKVYCSECKYKYDTLHDEVMYCTGKRTKDSVGHKKPVRMKEKK